MEMRERRRLEDREKEKKISKGLILGFPVKK